MISIFCNSCSSEIETFPSSAFISIVCDWCLYIDRSVLVESLTKRLMERLRNFPVEKTDPVSVLPRVNNYCNLFFKSRVTTIEMTGPDQLESNKQNKARTSLAANGLGYNIKWRTFTIYARFAKVVVAKKQNLHLRKGPIWSCVKIQYNDSVEASDSICDSRNIIYCRHRDISQ